MSRHKCYALSPRDCLKTTLFQKWQRIVAPPGKRGRRTVALHEKHQPVGKLSWPTVLNDNEKSVFLPAMLLMLFAGVFSFSRSPQIGLFATN